VFVAASHIYSIPDFYFYVILAVAGVAIAVSIWAVVDASSRPSWAFEAAWYPKGVWIGMIAVLTVLSGVGTLLAIWYFIRIRPIVVGIADHPDGVVICDKCQRHYEAESVYCVYCARGIESTSSRETTLVA